jgi:heat shock protein HslJ
MKNSTSVSGKFFNQIFICGLLLLTVAVALSCKSSRESATSDTLTRKNDRHNSQNSLDWAGNYRGLLPCADCSGINTVISLHADGTFTSQYKYEGKEDSTYKEEGTFSWANNGAVVILQTGTHKQSYKVLENGLLQLDQLGKPIKGALAGAYKLTKLDPQSIEEKYWKLTQLNGRPISFTGNKEPYMILKSADSSVKGFAGCNGFGGHFDLRAGNRIAFSKMISTMMACQDLDLERQFMEVLGKADNYSQHGDTLYLNKARMAPLAQFVAVYL